MEKKGSLGQCPLVPYSGSSKSGKLPGLQGSRPDPCSEAHGRCSGQGEPAAAEDRRDRDGHPAGHRPLRTHSRPWREDWGYNPCTNKSGNSTAIPALCLQ